MIVRIGQQMLLDIMEKVVILLIIIAVMFLFFTKF